MRKWPWVLLGLAVITGPSRAGTSQNPMATMNSCLQQDAMGLDDGHTNPLVIGRIAAADCEEDIHMYVELDRPKGQLPEEQRRQELKLRKYLALTTAGDVLRWRKLERRTRKR